MKELFKQRILDFHQTANNPRYPLELLLRVITVSLETMKVVGGLPRLS